MSYTLQLSLPTRAFEYPSKRTHHLQIICSSVQPNLQGEEEEEEEEEEETFNERVKGQTHVVLVERYGNGTAKRYILDDDHRLHTFLLDNGSADGRIKGSHFSNTKLSWVPDIIKDFILPAGFPGSVSDDYLQYMVLQFPTNITGWICHALVTSSLLKAVGVGSFTGTTAAASAAAIRWVSKDGIGAVGRLFIGLATLKWARGEKGLSPELSVTVAIFLSGGRFGSIFDDDPKQWRMYADFIGSAGSIFDLTTQVYPAYFLPLASLGNLTKAVARGLKDPSFRVIQNHFAISGNLGEVAAKDEVWEVTAQLIGLALGILILDTPGLVKSYPVLTLTWMSTRLLHLWLRYQSLSVLQFNTINLKRARILVKSHISHSIVPGCADCNRQENILSWQKFMKPRITFGVPLEEMVGGERSVSTFKEHGTLGCPNNFPSACAPQVKTLLKLYANEKYILVVNQWQSDFEVFVSFKVGATSVSVLRSVWQTYWLHENWKSLDNVFDELAHSLLEMEGRFDHFMQQLDAVGWDTHQINLKVPMEISIDELGPEPSSMLEH